MKLQVGTTATRFAINVDTIPRAFYGTATRDQDGQKQNGRPHLRNKAKPNMPNLDTSAEELPRVLVRHVQAPRGLQPVHGSFEDNPRSEQHAPQLTSASQIFEHQQPHLLHRSGSRGYAPTAKGLFDRQRSGFCTNSYAQKLERSEMFNLESTTFLSTNSYQGF